MKVNSYLIILANYIWDIHIVSRWTNIFIFFSSEYIDTHHVNLERKNLSKTLVVDVYSENFANINLVNLDKKKMVVLE